MPTQLLYNGYHVLPGGKAAGAWCWQPTTFQRRGCEWVWAVSPPPLCASIGISQRDLYLYKYLVTGRSISSGESTFPYTRAECTIAWSSAQSKERKLLRNPSHSATEGISLSVESHIGTMTTLQSLISFDSCCSAAVPGSSPLTRRWYCPLLEVSVSVNCSHWQLFIVKN